MIYKIYLYPHQYIVNSSSKNPYIDDLIESLPSDVSIINKKGSKLGILDAFLYLRNVNVFYFNWIESIVTRRFWFLQLVSFEILFIYIKIKKIPIIYTLHNKESHSNKRKKLSNYIIKQLINFSDLLIIHSIESLNYLKDKYPNCNSKKIFYHFHPIKPYIKSVSKIRCKSFDFLIWGTMFEYKGILEFLQELEKSMLLKKFSIKIIGHFNNDDYFKKVQGYESENILIENRFLTNDELNNLHELSRYILFPYLEHSVLNSGALAYSISLYTPVIGKNNGAFKELSDKGLIFTYNSVEDLVDIYSGKKLVEVNKIHDFVANNSWNSFSTSLMNKINKLNS